MKTLFLSCYNNLATWFWVPPDTRQFQVDAATLSRPSRPYHPSQSNLSLQLRWQCWHKLYRSRWTEKENRAPGQHRVSLWDVARFWRLYCLAGGAGPLLLPGFSVKMSTKCSKVTKSLLGWAGLVWGQPGRWPCTWMTFHNFIKLSATARRGSGDNEEDDAAAAWQWPNEWRIHREKS